MLRRRRSAPVTLMVLLVIASACTQSSEASRERTDALPPNTTADTTSVGDAPGAGASFESEDGARILGFGSGEPSLASLPAPAIVARLFPTSGPEQVGDFVTLEATINAVLYVDATRKDIPPLSDGPATVWGPQYVVIGPGDGEGFATEVSGQSLIGLLGYHADASGLPSSLEIMALLVETTNGLTFLGPNRDAYNTELASITKTNRSSQIEALTALSKELAQRDLSLRTEDAWTIPPLLAALSSSISVDWSTIPGVNKDVTDAPDEVRASLMKRTVIIEFETGAIAPGYVLGVLSDAGWSGMTALDTDVGFVVPALIDPGSKLRIMFARDSVGLDGLIQIAEIDSKTWESSAGIDVFITQALLDRAVGGDTSFSDIAVFAVLAEDSDVRDTIRRVSTVSDGGLTSGPGQEPGPDESEQLQVP
jgi:hypothetical protein